MTFQKPKGTVDYYPEEKTRINSILNTFRDISKKYGFNEVESPAIESLNLLTKKSGEEIKQQIFTLIKKGNEELGLRFDLTVPLTRMFIEKQKVLPKPVKWSYFTRMWRYEAPQAGRLREFYQYGVEIFGSAKPEADAEVISLAIDSLLALGLTKKDFFVKLNNRKLLEGLLLDVMGKEKIEGVIRIIDKKNKISEKEFYGELKKLKLDTEKIKNVNKIINTENINDIKVNNKLSEEGLNELKEISNLILDKKEFIKVDLSTARGLAYYTGTVFEIFDAKQKFRSICGGGRYDSLVKLFGGQDTPATGFSIGLATLTLLLQDRSLVPKVDLGPDYYIAVIGDVKKQAIEVANKLRKRYSVEIDLMQRNLKNQMEYADRIGAKNVIFIGEKELKSKKLTVKNMETRKEKRVSIEEI